MVAFIASKVQCRYCLVYRLRAPWCVDVTDLGQSGFWVLGFVGLCVFWGGGVQGFGDAVQDEDAGFRASMPCWFLRV